MENNDVKNDTSETVTEAENSADENAEAIKEIDAVESESESKPNEKDGFFAGLKKGWNKFWDKSKKFARETADTVNGYFSSQQEINALNKLFEEEATKFTDVKTGKTRFAIVSEDGGTLTLRKDGDGTILNSANDEIASGVHLAANGKTYEITAVDKDTDVTFAKEGNSQSLECFTVTVVEK